MKRSPLAIIFLTVFIDLVGFGIVIPILPYYAQQYDARPAVIGALMSIFSLMQFLMSPIWGRLSDRVGRRPVLLVALTAGMCGYLAMGFAQSLVWLFLARGLTGACGGSISASQAYIADVTGPQDRAKGMGMIGAAFGLGFILGPAIGGILSGDAAAIGHAIGGSFGAFLAAHHLALPMLFAAGLSFVNIVGAFLFLPESLPPEARTSKVRGSRLQALLNALTRPNLGALIVIFLLATTGFSMMESTFALLVQLRLHLGPSEVGKIFAFIGVIAVIVQGGLIGRLTRRFGEWRLLTTGLAFVALGLVSLTQAGGLAGVLLASACVAMGNALSTPSINSLISKCAGPQEQGGILGVSQSAGALGRIVGPSSGGFLFGLTFAGPYFAGAGLMILALCLAVFAASRAAAPAAPLTGA